MVSDLFLLDLLRTELETHSRVLEAGLVAAEADQSPGRMEPLMRAAHSLKGAARIAGLDIAVKLAHAMEDVLSAAQKGARRLETSDVNLLLEGNDEFLRLSRLEPASIPEELSRRAAEIQSLAEQIAGHQSASVSPPAAPAPAPPPASPVAAPAVSVPAPAQAVIAAAPAPAAKPEEASVRVFVDNLNRLTGLAGECLVEAKTLRPLGAALERIKQQHGRLEALAGRALDALGQESALEARARLEEALAQAQSIHRLLPVHAADFDRFSRKLELLANRLYDEAVASRMRPFGDGLHGFSRMARDLAMSLGKNARLAIEGEETRVDRDILEKLEAPLNHLVRNAVDHGLETPEERAGAGKAPEGRLELAARHVAGMLEVVVSDDGRGIDGGKLRARIVEKGYAAREMADRLSESEALEFLFLPGFSTAENVTEVSGRGVGLDVVQSMVRQVGGDIRVETRLGAGTRFTLQLPLTLSVLRTLLFEIRGEAYAIPLTRIDRVARVGAKNVEVVEDRQYFRLDGATIGLIDAGQALGSPPAARPPGPLCVVTLSDRLNRYGLVVDRFLGQRDVVVRPLHARLGKIPNVSAGAILEDGAPVLILDAEDLVRSIDNLLTRGGLEKVSREKRAVAAARKRILVVDDSLTVREVERRLLENRGYEVTVAIDGVDGWNTVQTARFDLVVTDIDMPRMDGIELVKRIKSAAHTARIPVMIVSYKEQEEYRLRGLEAGASHYLTKSSFHDETLAEAVRDLIGEAVGECG
ncbi:MAG: hybrid sensor histidine kinase/response regulator [Bryobacteraceae bacterium]|nr:hybrid sensor histidine kinase/response regulator [Bryobacteraceae bacterium]